ncbi:MAG: glycerol-3-phosphate acyltransferase [Clostridia bacterium]|nr:glycerol-3-phosphate acyltransferase [Clostridia bacterium]
MYNLLLIPFAIVAYLVGCINNAILLSKIKKVDIRTMGSGNPGTLNMSRNLGLKMGLLTFLLDMIKGASVPLVSYFVFKGRYFAGTEFLVSDFSMIMCGLFIIIGHIYPVFLRFKGGKGIASTIGLCFLLGATHKLFILTIVISIICAIIFIYKTEIGAIGSFIAITPPLIAEIVRLFVN